MKMYLKKMLTATLLLSGCLTFASAQTSSSKTVNNTVSASGNSTQSAQSVVLSSEDAEFSSLGHQAALAKALYEAAFQVSISEAAFRSKCQTTLSNKQEWMSVKNHFQADPDVDLTCIEAMLAAFDEKL